MDKKPDNTVFIMSLVMVLTVVATGIISPDFLLQLSRTLHKQIIRSFGWGYLTATFFFLCFSLFLAFSRFGDIKLGKDHEKPRYSYFGWFSMLFAAGMGIGLIFWGVAEPMSHFLNPPSYIANGSGTAAEFAMTHSFFHWGIQPWAIYIVMSLSIAFFSFRRGMPPLISSCFYPLIGEKIYGLTGYIIDILAVFATIFGIATSLGFGALQISSGLGMVLDFEVTNTVYLILIAIITVLFLASSLTGLDKGIQFLSKLNILIATCLLLFMLAVGPTSYILDILTSTTADYLSSFLNMSLSTNPFKGYDWTHSWTLFYWAWWISWSPFVGLFVASISRGRTVREFVLGALTVPTIFTFLWFSVFGGSAFDLEFGKAPGIAETITSNISTGLFELYSYYPFSTVLTIITIMLLVVFFITSADSATYVLAMMTSNGKLNPPTSRKIIWGLTESSVAAILLLSGGLDALQKMAIAAALPFTIIMVFMCRSLYSGMKYDMAETSDKLEIEDLPQESQVRNIT